MFCCSAQLRLMNEIRASIERDQFPDFVRSFISVQFGRTEVPAWIRDALAAVNITLP